MNNQQFRKLLQGGSSKSPNANHGSPASAASPAAGGSSSSLGSRQWSSVPMTPRSVGGAQADFARQLAERNHATREKKKFRTYAPKGTKLAAGYVDRAGNREDETEDDRAERLKALEESLKQGEIEQETFDRLRFEIAGGDLESTHLVKGLDYKLLARIRKGDDLTSSGQSANPDDGPVDGAEDVDDEFDQLEQQQVHAVAKEKAEKKGELSKVSLAPGKKRTRDQILADLKASREAAKAQQQSALGARFAKIGARKTPGTRIERDHKGREVLIIVDEDGHEKRKVRKVQPTEEEGQDEPASRNELLVPDKDAKPLGMEVPEQYRKAQDEEVEEEDVNIFDDVSDDYDPLAGMDDSDDSEDEGKSENETSKEDQDADRAKPAENAPSEGSMRPPPPPTPPAASAPRNYFAGSKTALVSSETAKAPSMSDPAIMAAIKRAAALKKIDADAEDDEKAQAAKAAEERRKRLLESASRDDEDLDMGFGTSRLEDEEDFDDGKVKLSVWGEDGEGDEGDSSKGGGKGQRKRRPKKRKGDGNSAADVLRVMEERKKS